METYIILFVLSVGVIIVSAFVLSAAKKYLRSPDQGCFAALRDRFIISLFFFLPMLAVLAFMLFTDFMGTTRSLLFLFLLLCTGTVHSMIPLLFFGSLVAAVYLWICGKVRYSKARKAYQSMTETKP